MNDFVAIFVLHDSDNSIKYTCEEFYGDIGRYPENNNEDIQMLISEVEDIYSFEGYKVVDVCEIIDSNGITLWNEVE